MTDLDWHEYSVETQAIRAGHRRSHEGEHSVPIHMTSSYVFNSAEEAALRFTGEQPGNIYSRFTNPTVDTFQQRLALMEKGDRCLAFASGMAAIMAVGMSLLKAGDHVVCSRSVFGNTVLTFENYFAKFGVETTFVELPNLDGWAAAIQPNTQFLFVETPSNPLMELVDIRALADIAHQKDCLLVVDNVICTPIMQQPLSLGADIVVHSATKYLDGQGRCVGGAVIASDEIIEKLIYPFLRTGGATMSAFNAWVFLSGLETLAVRMKAHCDSALELAKWLEQQPAVEKVHYPGLESHAQHELAKQQQSYFGAVVSFELKGGKELAWKLINATQMLSITANLGDVKSTITHPSTTTHGRLAPEVRLQAGIKDSLVRVSVGLENIEDIKRDLLRGLIL
ncbi:MAG: O-succinylhomoserine sulfhydrylase [Gammaproteobacteria bacterium]|jgi:O-succinylhomoserine sulfhydrylase|nr:O-succinylhomoserine sulfhydrylase [Gammaproteobacteria bacterium]MBT4145387.1 O-succinylhomoserine sulfhydrylase [Gammaproteobacteria bacterium]MBT5223035.1 O-succinylhomoserine sulfhydrylase [Gammaproteobacteria bacterium]MBT5825564.1 O-succinylhomoserine sulfhydrylase [Gammaproteobacteria bacterium]MBT6420307.1 O-succinylhomoserine sulfhydrylase [Gammaproteobacteria bacterium]